jgi:DNA polymerase-4
MWPVNNKANMSLRKIIHVDMDAFYASVEVKYRPELKGKPIAVGGSPEGRGVIATASYEARKFGVRSAMASATAIRLCPQLIIVRPDFSKYKKDSRHVRQILERFSKKIQPLSLDEAYIDVTDSSDFGGSATRIAEEIRKLVREEVGITASAGVAPNKFLAKIASDLKKPDGQTVIKPADIQQFMLTLPIDKIWGVGKVTASKMKAKGIYTCGDLQKYSIGDLTNMFGSWGPQLHDFARGIDDREVHEDRERKSLSVEETYFKDLQTLDECLEKLYELYDDWNERMTRAQLHEDIVSRIRGISVKLKFHDFKGTTHDRVFKGYPKIEDFKPLLIEAWDRRPEAVRLLGIGVKLEGADREDKNAAQLKLF